jgi:hypothetical protein
MTAPTLEERIREAAGAGEFTRAGALWQEYAAELRARIEAGLAAAGDMERAGDLVGWVRQVALAGRAQAADRVRAGRSTARAAQAYERVQRAR